MSFCTKNHEFCDKNQKETQYKTTEHKRGFTDNFIPLVNVIGTGKQNTATYHFTHNTTNWPNVHIFGVAHA